MPNEPGLTERVAPGSTLLDVAAQAIVSTESPPNLSSVIVLVPNLYVVQPLQRALHRAANGRALLLPTITTLALWAESMPLAKTPTPDSRRLAWLHSALRRGDWFPGLDLWHVAAEILTLIDDCASHGVALPDSVEDFQRVVRQALRATENHAIHFEAKLVHELWRALQSDQREIDRHGAYRLRLTEIADQAEAPLYIVEPVDATPAETQFFARYALRQSVCMIRSSDVHSAAQSSLFALLDQAWCEPLAANSLRDRAQQFVGNFPESPAHTLRLFGARSLEQEAQAVELTVRRWLTQGKKNIAIIAQDRLTARRARARLERAQILIADESGWTLSTTTASSVAMRWLDVIGSDFYFRDVFDLLSSPFLFHAIGETDRRAAALELERLLVEANYISGMAKFAGIVERVMLTPGATQIAETLITSARRFDRKPRTLSTWLRALLASLDQLGATVGLLQDAAGADLLRLLQNLAAELNSERETYSLGEWRRWLDRQLEDASFRDAAIDSSVVLTHLGLTDGRSFDGVILLGADADHLPSPSASALFNESVLKQLGLPSREQRNELERRRLMHVLANSKAALVTWQAHKNGEPNPASPYWVRLSAFHRVAYGEDLADSTLARLLVSNSRKTTGEEFAPVRTMPQPSASSLLPKSISASQYSSLIACPYQFFAQYHLALRADDEILEAMEKRDYGDVVHRILAKFHRRYPLVTQIDEEVLLAALRDISASEFQAVPDGDYFSRAWNMRWEKLIPAYIAWQQERESMGWRWQASEVSREREIELESGTAIRLRGRFDRIDVRQDEVSVLDYKTGASKSLKDRAANPDEDGQLPFYGMIAPALSIELAYVAIDGDPVIDYAMSGNVAEIVAAHFDRLRRALGGIEAGEGLPAHGSDSVCAYCDAVGICRKPYWNNGDGS
jgi:ATP-dependent helicase/nuclease subunit B